MSRNSTYEPELSDDDIEAIGDAALGISESVDPEVKRKRLQRVGAKLNARQALSDRRKAVFITTLAQTGIVSRAAAAAGWANGTAYDLRKTDKQFEKLWKDAVDFSTDALEEAARTRAIDGVQKPVYQQKELVGYVTEYSDTLLALLLKAKRPKEFRENFNIEADVKGGVLIVPGVASDRSWEASAGANQLTYRSNSGNAVEDDPLA